MKLKCIKNKIVSVQGIKKFKIRKNFYFIVICIDNENCFSFFFYLVIRIVLINLVKNIVNCFLYNLMYYWYIYMYFRKKFSVIIVIICNSVFMVDLMILILLIYIKLDNYIYNFKCCFVGIFVLYYIICF